MKIHHCIVYQSMWGGQKHIIPSIWYHCSINMVALGRFTGQDSRHERVPPPVFAQENECPHYHLTILPPPQNDCLLVWSKFNKPLQWLKAHKTEDITQCQLLWLFSCWKAAGFFLMLIIFPPPFPFPLNSPSRPLFSIKMAIWQWKVKALVNLIHVMVWESLP